MAALWKIGCAARGCATPAVTEGPPWRCCSSFPPLTARRRLDMVGRRKDMDDGGARHTLWWWLLKVYVSVQDSVSRGFTLRIMYLPVYLYTSG